MNKSLFGLITALMLLSFNISHAQGIVNVSPMTGTATAYIPIYTISNGQVSIPVGVSYSTNGVKTMDVEGTAGMGWNLEAGGQISRLVRGIPDDCLKDTVGHAVL